MIRIATYPNKSFRLSKKKIDVSIEKLLQDNIDIICFQKTSSPKTDNLAMIEKLSRSLGMTYTFSNVTTDNAAGSDKKNKRSKTTLSILNGKNTWMLNSGSLNLSDEPKDERHAQFALIRHNGNSILVINAFFSATEPQIKNQLKNLLSLHMLNEQYGAVVVNSNLDNLLPPKELTRIFEQESFKVHSTMNGESSVALLSAKENPPAALTLHQPEKADITQFCLDRSAKHILKKKYSRLSFRERWMGSRDGDRAFAF